MKTNKKHSTKNNKASTSLSELQSRSEQLSGNNNSETEKSLNTQNSELTTAPAADSQPSTLNSQPADRPTINHQQPTITPGSRILPYVDFQQREANRALATDEVLGLLRQWVPDAYSLAEIVGKWVWITFPEAPAEKVRGQLSQFGFHWNNVRKCWQHPCGQFATTGASQDPRHRYGSRLATAA